MDSKEIDERWFTCDTCGGTGKVRIPLTVDDMEEMELTELFDVCPECNGIGEVEADGIDPCMAYHQHNDF